ncbi:hypothetical protein H4S02_006226 [Coemansia sp. RSA 2611]|nr:hypothetical protein H4S02_006226 [Coemansia sp. RSA 2611]
MRKEYSLNITVVTDAVCPWCYVGDRRLAQALDQAKQKWPEFEATIDYAPFQLDTAMGKGLDKTEVYRRKFGDRAADLNQRLAEAGSEVGIEFKFGGLMSNTLDWHRLVDYAKLQGGAGADARVVQSLFRRYFEQEQDIGDHEVLLAAAADAGLDRERTRAYLQSDDGIDALRERMAQIRKLGVTGVPFYIINDQFGISGAETPDTFVAAFEKVFQCQCESK